VVQVRALRQLRDEGLLEFRRGRGIPVTPEQRALIEQAKNSSTARTRGYKPDELSPDELSHIIQQLA
jgi:GntR family transcriptional regulator